MLRSLSFVRVGGACGPPPPVVAALASSLRTPSRGDPPLKACGRRWAASPPAALWRLWDTLSSADAFFLTAGSFGVFDGDSLKPKVGFRGRRRAPSPRAQKRTVASCRHVG